MEVLKMRKIILFIFAMAAINATTPTYENVTTLYVATFDRTPDVTGLKYWVNDSGLSLEGTARSFFSQPETKAKYYPDGTIYLGNFIDEVYVNLFDRAPDSVGREYWLDAMYTGRDHYSTFILAVINGAQGNDAVILADKTKYAMDAISDELAEEVSTFICCHNYTFYLLTGIKEKERLTPKDLRKKLLGKDLTLTKHSYPAGSDWKIVQGWLYPYDVIIIGNAHSGMVKDFDRRIWNYIGNVDKGTVHKDQLYDLMNQCKPVKDSPTGHTNCPYKNKPVELWRWVR